MRPGLVRPLRRITNIGVCAGTRNIFIAVEPKGGHRQAEVTARRTKTDFVRFIGQLVEKVYAGAQKIHLVMDNLNTHFRRSFVEVLGIDRAEQMLERVETGLKPVSTHPNTPVG